MDMILYPGRFFIQALDMIYYPGNGYDIVSRQ